MAASPPNSAPTVPPHTQMWQGRRILLVDDDESFVRRLARALEHRGILTQAALSVEDALGRIESFEPDAVITDLKMPGADGLELVTQLATQLPTARLLMLTGYGSVATAVEAMKRGAFGYLLKPCNADQVLSALSGSEVIQPEADYAAQLPTLARLEREHIERVLMECDGNVSKAARVLGIHRRTLQYKLAKFAPTK